MGIAVLGVDHPVSGISASSQGRRDEIPRQDHMLFMNQLDREAELQLLREDRGGPAAVLVLARLDVVPQPL